MSTINGTGHSYMSNAEIIIWMQEKTGAIYGQMRDAMDVSDSRANCEEALNDLKTMVMQAKNAHADPVAVSQKVQEILKEFGDEFPDIQKALQPIADELGQRFKAAGAPEQPDEVSKATRNVHIVGDDADAWGKQIGEKVDALGKDDQLGMINIQEFNAQLNQAKQTASALIDASNKSASAIINNIG